MFQRGLELVLLGGLVVGLYFLWQSAAVHRHYAQEHHRLTRKIGNPPIRLPNKVSIQALDTGEPRHFAWRMHIPDVYDYGFRSLSDVRTKVSSSTAEDFVFRYRFYQHQGQWFVYVKTYSGEEGSAFPVKTPALIKCLANDAEWQVLQIEQFGAAGPVEVDFGRIVTLLKFSRSPGAGPNASSEPLVEWLCFGPHSLYDDPNLKLPAE